MSLVEVIYAPTPATLFYQEISYIEGMTVADVLNQSLLFAKHPEARNLAVGVFAKQVTLETVLKPGDRVELYRPLLCDPKERRRARARTTKRIQSS